MSQASTGPFWQEALAPYAQPRLARSLLDLATSVVPYLALSVAMYLTLGVSYLLVLALAIPAAGFLVRTFIVFHDCAHGSFLPLQARQRVARRAARAASCYSPFLRWRHDHAVHHATSGDLDRRGVRRRADADGRRVPRALARAGGSATACSATRW